MQTAIWLILSQPLWNKLASLKHSFYGNFKEISLSISTLGLLFFGLLYAVPFRSGSPLQHHNYKMIVLTLIAFCLIIAPACIGIWLVQVALETMSFSKGQSNTDTVLYFLDLRDHLQFFLVIAGTSIGAATLAAGALRNALIAWAESETLILVCATKNFPAELVWLYGLYMTALIALIYTPTFMTLRAKGREICDFTYPKPSSNLGSSDSWVGWYSNRKKIEELLELQLGVIDSLKIGISILTPLAGSAVSFLLGSK